RNDAAQNAHSRISDPYDGLSEGVVEICPGNLQQEAQQHRQYVQPTKRTDQQYSDISYCTHLFAHSLEFDVGSDGFSLLSPPVRPNASAPPAARVTPGHGSRHARRIRW